MLVVRYKVEGQIVVDLSANGSIHAVSITERSTTVMAPGAVRLRPGLVIRRTQRNPQSSLAKQASESPVAFPLAKRNRHMLSGGLPGSTADDSFRVRLIAGRTDGILAWALRVVIRLVYVLAPFRKVPIEVMDAPRVWLLRAYGMCLTAAVLAVPRMGVELALGAKWIVTGRTTTGREFPFGFRWQSVPILGEVARPAAGRFVVTGIESFGERPFIAIDLRISPRN